MQQKSIVGKNNKPRDVMILPREQPLPGTFFGPVPIQGSVGLLSLLTRDANGTNKDLSQHTQNVINFICQCAADPKFIVDFSRIPYFGKLQKIASGQDFSLFNMLNICMQIANSEDGVQFLEQAFWLLKDKDKNNLLQLPKSSDFIRARIKQLHALGTKDKMREIEAADQESLQSIQFHAKKQSGDARAAHTSVSGAGGGGLTIGDFNRVMSETLSTKSENK